MKKMVLLLTLILSASLTFVCLAGEMQPLGTDEEVMTDAEMTDTEESSETAEVTKTEEPAEAETVSETQEVFIPETDMDIFIGTWYLLAKDNFGVPLSTYAKYYFYPDGTVTDEYGTFCFPAEFEEDNRFTIDTSSMEEYADYTVTGQIMPVSQDDLEQYNVQKDIGYINYSSYQMILSISYPDPANPLATSDAVTTVYCLRMTSQYEFLKRFMYGNTWKIDDHILDIDEEGNLNLDYNASTGKAHLTTVENNSLYIPVQVRFNWEHGGTVNYLTVMVTEDTIQLQNIDKPEEILLLEKTDRVEITESEDIQMAEPSKAENSEPEEAEQETEG